VQRRDAPGVANVRIEGRAVFQARQTLVVAVEGEPVGAQVVNTLLERCAETRACGDGRDVVETNSVARLVAIAANHAVGMGAIEVERARDVETVGTDRGAGPDGLLIDGQ